MAIFEAPEARNKNIENYDDLPKDEVEREDGLPTVKDMEEIMGKKKPMHHPEGSTPAIELIIKICS